MGVPIHPTSTSVDVDQAQQPSPEPDRELIDAGTQEDSVRQAQRPASRADTRARVKSHKYKSSDNLALRGPSLMLHAFCAWRTTKANSYRAAKKVWLHDGATRL